jgi:hypothetical protein
MWIQDATEHEAAGFVVAQVQINGTDECLKGITVHGSVDRTVLVMLDEVTQANLFTDGIERLSVDDFGSHLSQKALIFCGIYFKEKFCNNTIQDRISQEFKSLITLSCGFRIVTISANERAMCHRKTVKEYFFRGISRYIPNFSDKIAIF